MNRGLTSADEIAAATLDVLPSALILVFDRELRFVLAAGKALERQSASSAFREGKLVGDAFPASVWSVMEPLCRSALAGETRSREVWTEGREHRLMIDVGPLRPDGAGGAGAGDEAGEVPSAMGGVAVVLDVTAAMRGEEGSAHSHDHFEQVFERAPIGTGLLDLDGRWMLVNHALCEITGYTVDELTTMRFDDITHPDDVQRDGAQREGLLAGRIAAYQVEKRYFDASGGVMSAMVSVSLVRDGDGEPLHYIAQLQDISERKRLEEHLRHLADHDPLTGLRNRRLFEHDLRLQAARSRRYGEIAALMVIDLDDFKHVNDGYGHKAGDDMLVAVARALTRRLRETDLVARLGGDEFAVLLPHIDRQGVQTVADGLARVIATCAVDVGDTVLHPAASIGSVIVDAALPGAEQAMVDADQAMYEVKRAKRAGTGAA